MDLLETRLRDLAGALDYPAPPQLRSRVRAQIQPRAARPWTRWALAAAAALLLAGAAVLAGSPGARDTVAGWLGLRNLQIRHVEVLPSPALQPPGSIGRRLSLGDRYALADAERLAGFRISAPQRLGKPDAVYYSPRLNAVTLVYGTQPDYLFSELKAGLPTQFFGKLVGPGTTITQVRVGTAPGVWLEGSPHDIFLQLPDGSVQADQLRLAGNTLLWEEGGITYRLEGAPTLAAALAIAGTVSR